MKLFGTLTEGLGTAIDVYQARHNVLAENIANSETPGYRARDIEFADQLAQALTSTPANTPGDHAGLDGAVVTGYAVRSRRARGASRP